MRNFSVIMFLCLVCLQGQSASKKKKVEPESAASLRELASQELAAKTSTKVNSTPSIMAPLHDSYKPSTGRSWRWAFEARLASRAINAVKPSNEFGPNSLMDLGQLPFLQLATGADRQFDDNHFGLNVTFAYANKRSSFTSASQLVVPIQIQWTSYGIEPNWSRSWSSWFGTTLAYNFDIVNLNQNSTISPLASWARNYNERGPRAALNFYLKKTLELTSEVNLAVASKASEFGEVRFVSLDYGVRW